MKSLLAFLAVVVLLLLATAGALYLEVSGSGLPSFSSPKSTAEEVPVFIYYFKL